MTYFMVRGSHHQAADLQPDRLHCDEMTVGMQACSDHIPDIWEIADGFAGALREFAEARAALEPTGAG